MKKHIPIYVVSLASDIERRESLRKQFPNHYDEFIFIDAIDFREKNKNEIVHLYKECKWNARKPLTPTEAACAFSHNKVLEHFLYSNNSACIILEDDILGNDHDLLKCTEIISNTQGEFIFLLGGQEGMKNRKYILGSKLEKHWKLDKQSLLFCVRTCAYAVSRQVAEELILQNSICLDRSDNWERKIKKTHNAYFINAISHPLDLQNSHIESGRNIAKGGFFRKLYQDGFVKSARANAIKIKLLLTSKLTKKTFILKD